MWPITVRRYQQCTPVQCPFAIVLVVLVVVLLDLLVVLLVVLVVVLVVVLLCENNVGRAIANEPTVL